MIAIPFDFVADVTCFLSRFSANPNAYRMIRSTPFRVKTDVCVTVSLSVPSNILPPMEEYSPSVFSRTTR